MGLDTVELVLSVEQVFDIEIPDAAAADLDTVGKLHAFIVAELLRLGRTNINADIVFDQLRTIICSRLGVKPEDVIPAARFVQDLGAD
jgi:acyl carrier protein